MYRHTPAPWSTNDLLTGGTVVLHNAKPGYRARLDDAGRFNAHDAALIAAAPDMLAALERAADFLEVQAEHYERNLRRCIPADERLYQNGATNYRAAVVDARAAIAKAKGA